MLLNQLLHIEHLTGNLGEPLFSDPTEVLFVVVLIVAATVVVTCLSSTGGLSNIFGELITTLFEVWNKFGAM